MLEFTAFCVGVIVLLLIGRFAFLWWYRRGLRERTYGYSDWFEQRDNVPWSGGNGPHDTNMKSNIHDSYERVTPNDVTGQHAWETRTSTTGQHESHETGRD